MTMENGQMTGNFIIKYNIFFIKSKMLFFDLYHHRPDVTNRVFYHKLKDLMADIRQKEYFGSIKALVGVIEFQVALS